MEKFAGYGFNKSHSAAYALLAYQTAYFNAPHRSVHGRQYERGDERHRQGAATAGGLIRQWPQFEAPDVNLGEYRFVPIDRKTIRYGLGGVKGTGEGAVIEILRARSEGGPFRICSTSVVASIRRRSTVATVEALIKAGAFDKLHPNRASAFASVAAAPSEAERQANASQNSLFGDEPSVQDVPLVDARPWELLESLAYEKTALGCTSAGTPTRFIAAICNQ